LALSIFEPHRNIANIEKYNLRQIFEEIPKGRISNLLPTTLSFGEG
jgi:hypothetical protein